MRLHNSEMADLLFRVLRGGVDARWA